MKHIKQQSVLVVGVVAAGILAVAGSAFTASNSFADPAVVQGFGQQDVSGVTVQSVTYNLDALKENVLSVTFVLAGDTTADTIETGFNTDAPTTCGGGVYSAGTDDTTYTACAITSSVDTVDRFYLTATGT
jgi:hypothetical protein